ncbi:MAG: hypothetical protein ACP5NK_02215 [Thermoplasmata archaeon]
MNSIDDSLDMICILRHGNQDPIEQFSDRFRLFVPAIPRVREGNMELLYHVPKTSSEDRDMRLFLEKFGARDSGYFYTMLATARFYPAIGSLKRIYDIPTTVLDAAFLDKGYHIIYFRFNHLFTRAVTETVLELQADQKSQMDLIYLGPNDNSRNAENEYRNRIGLASIKLSMEYPSPIHNLSRLPLYFAFKAISSPGDLRGLYLFEGPSASGYAFSDSAVRISENFVEDRVAHKYSLRMFELLMKSPVLLISNRAYYNGTNLDIEFTLSKNTARNFLSILGTILKEFPESRVTILSYSSV